MINDKTKRKLKRLICSHEWEIWTIGLNKATCRCKKCDAIRNGVISWSKPKGRFDFDF